MLRPSPVDFLSQQCEHACAWPICPIFLRKAYLMSCPLDALHYLEHSSNPSHTLCKAAVQVFCIASHPSCCHVLRLLMPVSTAQGPLPEQLGALSHLQSLNLSSNELTGSLPVSIGQLQTQSGVWLDHNQLSGSLSQAWCNASVTSAVHVDYNAGLYGAVPQCLQGRLQQGSSFAGTGLIQVENNIEASSSGSSGSSNSSSSSSHSGSSSSAVGGSGSGAEAPICSTTSCGLVCLLHALVPHHPPSNHCHHLATKLAAISLVNSCCPCLCILLMSGCLAAAFARTAGSRL